MKEIDGWIDREKEWSLISCILPLHSAAIGRWMFVVHVFTHAVVSLSEQFACIASVDFILYVIFVFRCLCSSCGCNSDNNVFAERTHANYQLFTDVILIAMVLLSWAELCVVVALSACSIAKWLVHNHMVRYGWCNGRCRRCCGCSRSTRTYDMILECIWFKAAAAAVCSVWYSQFNFLYSLNNEIKLFLNRTSIMFTFILFIRYFSNAHNKSKIDQFSFRFPF